MSPEQAAGEDADHSRRHLLVRLHPLRDGHREVPFTSDTFMGTLTKQMFETPLAPRQLRPDLPIPHALEEVILKTLAKDPSQRYQSTQEIAHLLDSCMEDPGGQAEVGGQRSTEPQRRGRGPDLSARRDHPRPALVERQGRAPEVGDPVGDISLVEHPDEHPPRRSRRHEPTEPVRRLPRPSGGTSLGWVALAALLVVGLLITGMLLWRRSVAERRRQRALAAAAPRLDAGAIKPDAPTRVPITLNTLPQGAEVWQGNRLLGKTQLEVQFKAGVPSS
jgi:hypothetical protein